MDSTSKPEQCFNRILPDCVDCYSLYEDELDKMLQKDKVIGQDFNDLYNAIVTRIKANLQLEVDPYIIFEKLRHDFIAKKLDPTAFLNSIKSLQQLFYSNQEIRSANISVKLNAKKLPAPSCNLQNQRLLLSFLYSQQKTKPALHNLVDSDLRPIYSTYLHFYEPRYFPISHKSINSQYLSNIIHSILSNSESYSRTVLKSELRSTKKMRDELISFSVQARTEYELFNHARDFPSTDIVKKSVLYVEKQKLYESVKKNFFTDFQYFVKGIDVISQVSLEAAVISDTMIKQYNEVLEKLCIIHGRARSLNNQNKTLNYFQTVFDNQKSIMNLKSGPLAQPIGALFEPLMSWEQSQNASLAKIQANLDYPNPKLLEKILNKFRLMKQRLDNVGLVMRQNEATKERERREKSQEFSALKAAKQRRVLEVSHDDKGKFIDRISNAFSSNLERIKIQDDLAVKVSSILCSVATICDSKPIIEGMDYLTKNEEAEIRQRMKECEALETLKDEKLAEIEKIQSYINNCKSDLHKNHICPADSQIIGANSEQSVGTDERYAEARLFVSCMNCDDAISSYFVVSCNHKICQKCFEKSKRKKVSFCPVCEQVVKSFIKLNW